MVEKYVAEIISGGAIMREVRARTIEDGYLLLEFTFSQHCDLLEKLKYRDVTVDELKYKCTGADYDRGERPREKHEILCYIENTFCQDDPNGMEWFEQFKNREYRLVKVTHEDITIEDKLDY